MRLTDNITFENHMLPFFWQHGEDEATLRHYVGVIQDANCQAFCVESRPHPDFCGPKWWADMDIILDEAKKRGMQVWILDDSHFPTGFANGAAEKAPAALARRSVGYQDVTYHGRARKVNLPIARLMRPMKVHMSAIQQLWMINGQQGHQRVFDDDRLLCLAAYGPHGEVIDLTGQTVFHKPEGDWRISAATVSGNYGPHRNYINMMNRESCRLLIDACYEPHFARYGALFGTTIAGFFSDEPELGNGALYGMHNLLGTQQDLPWSDELETALEQAWGSQWRLDLPLLWRNDGNPDRTHRFRVCYMDQVTRLVQQDFSYQVGDWCRAHGVRYIGHYVEDQDTHTCTGSGLGHFFRALSGQDMAGIDDIGNQVLPQGEDKPTTAALGWRNGGFYHYTLGKLGVSLAHFNPRMNGNAMCEIFGNYGWKSGVYEQKYLADHFLVRGINWFVPHAFSPKAYPDSDCPPHFYANGHNPQYRAFGQICGYMNRVASCLCGGDVVAKAAIWYNAESDWAGACMRLDEPARRLYDAQIDYYFIPTDNLDRADEFDCVLVPACDYAPEKLMQLPNALFVDRLPGNYPATEALAARVVPLDGMVDKLVDMGLQDAVMMPANNRMRVLHYRGREELFFLVNEGDEAYEGSVFLPVKGSVTAYDAWNNEILPCDAQSCPGGVHVALNLQPRKSLMLLVNAAMSADIPIHKASAQLDTLHGTEMKAFSRSVCRSIDYPHFGEAEAVILPDVLSRQMPDFSGYIRYDSTFKAQSNTPCFIVITEPCEAVEVFVNGISAGIQVTPAYIFDVSRLIQDGENHLRIELATTLERENLQLAGKSSREAAPTGLTGTVKVYRHGRSINEPVER